MNFFCVLLYMKKNDGWIGKSKKVELPSSPLLRLRKERETGYKRAKASWFVRLKIRRSENGMERVS